MQKNVARFHLLPKEKLIVITAFDAVQLVADQSVPFIQESNFLWLTQVQEAGWKAIVEHGELTLVRPERSGVQKIFDGEIDDQAVIESSGAKAIIEHSDFQAYLRQLARKHSVVYSIYDTTEYGFVRNSAQKELDELLRRLFPSVQSYEKDLKRLRAVKQDDEIVLLQKSIDLTVSAFSEAKEQLQSMRYEYEIEALFGYLFRKQNAQHAYEPIVASGKGACTLHYTKNDQKLKKGQLILLDVGARKAGYCADITRTYAIGKPTKRQSHVHEMVANAAKTITAMLKPGLSTEEYSRNVDVIMKQALVDLKLMKTIDDDDNYRRYFPHAISHGLGIDVHDSLGCPRYFEPGMVLTVEPGIYIPEENIGVRIEDDILITSNGHKNMSAKLSTDL